jgi:Tub family
LKQHADAKELTALYISSGVPIYPRSLGHSYHTLVWRMNIEAQEMQSKAPGLSTSSVAVPNNNNGGTVPPVVVDPVDRFFAERYETRAREGLNYSITYLEEKSLFMLSVAKKSGDASGFARNNTRHTSQGPNRFAVRPGPPQHHLPHHHGHGNLHDAPFHGEAGHAQHRVRFGHQPAVQVRGQGLTRSRSQSRDPKVRVKLHRHLLDQHLLGRSCVDDKDGTMMTAPINLSADFFHPVFQVRDQSRPRRLISEPKEEFSPHAGPLHGEILPGLTRPLGGAGEIIDDVFPPEGVAGASSVSLLGETTDSDSDGGVSANHHAPDAIFEPPNGRADAVVAAARRTQATAGLLPMNPPVDIKYPQPLTSILVDVDLDVYCAMTPNKETGLGHTQELEVPDQLKSTFAFYQRRLEGFLAKQDNYGFDECMLDFWDEFLPETANIHYYDRYTSVPRISCLHKFLTKPCPKAIGVVQCEIERIKIGPKKKGVSMKGRFFPTYEYRLFIRHRPPDIMEGPELARRDTVLMMAKNKGRKPFEASGSVTSNKKGANNYFLYLPDQDDVDKHFKSVNGHDVQSMAVYNGANSCSLPTSSLTLMGRLQSNFIGTEFQIFSPQGTKKPNLKLAPEKSYINAVPSGAHSPSCSEDEIGDDYGGVSSDNANSSQRKSRFARLSLRRNCGGNPSEPATITDDDSSVKNPIRRSRSSGDNEGSRRTRTSRRAIANNSDETFLQRVHPAPLEMEDGAITYTANLLGSRPRIMDVCIPKVSPEGVSGAEWKRYLDKCVPDPDIVGANRMLNHLKHMQQRMDNDDRSFSRPNAVHIDASEEADEYSPPEDFGLLALQNRPPWWNIELGSFVLNFGGRVSVASVKNFQLCDRNDQDHIMLQFGRIQGRHSFTMDFQHPLTAVQAFAIAISSLQSKLSLG